MTRPEHRRWQCAQTRAFEPLPIKDGWACPCQDAYGQAAVLNPVHNYADETARMGALSVENYVCDQNGDRWQRIVDPAGAATWHYLGREVGSGGGTSWG